MPRMNYTTKRGRVHLHSEKQHRYMHFKKLDHTHHEEGKEVRETFPQGKLKKRTYRTKRTR